ncbi:MAG: hypothetical protein ACKOZZ_15585, partial [Bacteroidota bacterium]
MSRIFLCSCLIFIACASLNARTAKDSLWNTVHKEMEQLLFENMLPVWYPRVMDIEKGGFFSDFTYDWKPEGSQQKMIVTQARHVWSLAQLKMFTG